MKPISIMLRLGLAICLLLPMSAYAVDTAGLTPQLRNGITYVSGGVGKDQQEQMAVMRKDYNLQLTFANKKTGEFRADVQVALQNATGAEVLNVTSDGPMFFAQLPSGAYRVTATSAGKAQTQSVTLGKDGARELNFYWDPVE